LLYEIFGDHVFERRDLFPVLSFMPGELKTLRRMLEGGLNAPKTSSAGRLFDAVASIIGLREKIRYEGQAAMELEFLTDREESGVYEFELAAGTPLVVDWEPMIHGIIADTADGNRAAHIAAKFHNTLVEMMVRMAVIADERSVVLSGGCFQNKYLTERAISRLRESGFNVYWHQRVPTNDGGIALGQTVAAAWSLADNKNGGGKQTLCA
jgi:hydrogenase maturation protein HypF